MLFICYLALVRAEGYTYGAVRDSDDALCAVSDLWIVRLAKFIVKVVNACPLRVCVCVRAYVCIMYV